MFYFSKNAAIGLADKKFVFCLCIAKLFTNLTLCCGYTTVNTKKTLWKIFVVDANEAGELSPCLGFYRVTTMY